MVQCERLEEIEVTKNPHNVGVWRIAHSPHLAELIVHVPPELAPFLRGSRWVAGLRRAVSLHLSG